MERGADDWNCRLHPSNPFPKPLSLREIWLGTIQALLTPTSRLHPETIKRWKLGDTDLAWLRLYLTHIGDCISTDNQIRTIMWFILLHQKCWHDCCLQFSTWQYLVCFMYCLKTSRSVLLRFNNSSRSREFLNLMIHDCEFFEQLEKLSLIFCKSSIKPPSLISPPFSKEES